MITLKIVEFYRDITTKSIQMKVLIDDLEFRHLNGYVEEICLFAVKTIDCPTKITRTGARHNHAKWILVPKKLRSLLPSPDYNYDNVKVGFLEFKDSVFLIYRIDKNEVI